MDANMLKHLAMKGIDQASPLGRFLLTVQEVKKSIIQRRLAEEQSACEGEIPKSILGREQKCLSQ